VPHVQTLIAAVALLALSGVLWALESAAGGERVASFAGAMATPPGAHDFWRAASGLADGLAAFTLLLVLWTRGLVPGRRVQLSAVTFLAVGLLVGLVKLLVARERPVHGSSDDYSWPSGHAAAAMALGIALIGAGRTRTILGIALTLVLGASRVALERHWPSDVVAGFGAALLCAAFLQRLPTRLPDAAPRGPLAALAIVVSFVLLVRAGVDDMHWHVREAWRTLLLLALGLALTAPASSDASSAQEVNP
jgi:undecaprenyl-diphosphatase